MKKKILLTLAIVSILVCALAISVSAEHDVTRKVTLDNGTEVNLYDSNGYALTYYLDENGELVSAKTVDIISVNGSGVATYSGVAAMSVVVANFQGAEVEALNVKQVPSYYYGNYGGGYHSYNDTIEYIYLPDTLTQTATNQFRCTSKLKIVDVTRNSQWQTMGQYSFYYATGLTEFYYPPKVKTTPGSGNDGVERGTAATFSHCTSLKSLYFYDNSEVETFGDYCFTVCSALETVMLPNTITSLPKGVFSSCTSLKEISIPNSVKTIASHAFAWCTSLEVIRMGDGFQYFNNTGDNSFTYTTGKVKEIYIPKSFYATAPDTSLGYQVSYAFHGANANCKFFYCGTADEFATAKANFLTQKSATSNNGSFLNATVITYAEYLANPDTYATGRYVVCEYNTCDAFYENEHVGEEKLVFTGEKLLSSANVCVICTRCNKTETTDTRDALFTNKGYSKSIDGVIMQGFAINKNLVGFYEEWLGTINYGLVAGVCSYVDGEETKYVHQAGELLTLNEGNVVANEKVATVSFDQKPEYDVFEMKLKGLTGDLASTEVFCCAYVVYGNTIYYINNNVVTEGNAGTAVSIGDIQ